MNSPKELANVIKKRAKSLNISIGALLSNCELSKNTLSSMQSGGYYPRIEAICKIADCLDCSVDYLLGLTDEPKALKLTKTQKELFNIILKLDDEQVPLLFEKLDDILNKKNEKKQ